VRVLAGRFDQGTVLDMALSDAERQAGFGLMCMAKPEDEEIVIEWGTADAQPRLFPPRENQLFVLTDRIMRTPRIAELRLRPVGTPMRYWPGQYVMLGDERAGAPPRSYSIAGAPRPDGEIALQVTRVDDGLTSTWIHDRLRPGDRVKIAGPYGTFIGDPSVDTPVLCLAAGSGLAPVLSLTEAALRRGFKRPVTLLFSARSSADLYDAGLLQFWLAKHRNFRYRTTLTREPGPDLSGRIPQVLPGSVPDLRALGLRGRHAGVRGRLRAGGALARGASRATPTRRATTARRRRVRPRPVASWRCPRTDGRHPRRAVPGRELRRAEFVESSLPEVGGAAECQPGRMGVQNRGKDRERDDMGRGRAAGYEDQREAILARPRNCSRNAATPQPR
jgi:CDP-4-dehydro-6-deoxyglucose reductase